MLFRVTRVYASAEALSFPCNQVGAAAAHYQFGSVAAAAVGRLVGGAICIIAWLNLSNDGFDAETGVDKAKAESVVNLTGSRGLVLGLSAAFFAAGAWLLAGGLGAAASGAPAAMLAAAIACGYIYQGPPFRCGFCSCSWLCAGFLLHNIAQALHFPCILPNTFLLPCVCDIFYMFRYVFHLIVAG